MKMNRKWGSLDHLPEVDKNGKNGHAQGKLGDISATCHPINFLFGSRAFGVGGSNGPTSG